MELLYHAPRQLASRFSALIHLPPSNYLASPEGPGPSAAEMNWAVVIYVYAPVVPSLAAHSTDHVFLRPFQIFAVAYWYFRGYKTFTGPRPNLPPTEKEKVDIVTDNTGEEIAGGRS